MKNRPKINLKLSSIDILIEIITIIILISFWIMNTMSFANLPDNIPTHYNGIGKVDGYGSKNTIFLLPILATVIFVLLTYLSKKPETFNYIEEITQENAAEQYKNSTTLMRFMKLSIIIIFIIIDYNTINIALEKDNTLGKWFLPFTIGLIFIPILFSVFKSLQLKKQTKN